MLKLCDEGTTTLTSAEVRFGIKEADAPSIPLFSSDSVFFVHAIPSKMSYDAYTLTFPSICRPSPLTVVLKTCLERGERLLTCSCVSACAMSSAAVGSVHPDLVLERSKASFDVSKMSLFVRGGPQMAALRDRLLKLLSSHPVRPPP